MLVPVQIFQFPDMRNEIERYRDATNGLLVSKVAISRADPLSSARRSTCRSVLSFLDKRIAGSGNEIGLGFDVIFFPKIRITGDVFLLGKASTFRYNHPGEAAKLRKKRMVCDFLIL